MEYKTIEFGGFILKIEQEQEPENPRDWDNRATMYCEHRNYSLGDSDAEKIAIDDENYYILPLYLYDHSGITMNTTGFSCPWDSGQVGIIYMHKTESEEGAGLTRERAEEIMVQEVKTYDQYLRGEVYGFILEKTFPDKEIDGKIYSAENEELDSCWGFTGDTFEESGIMDCIFDGNDLPKDVEKKFREELK